MDKNVTVGDLNRVLEICEKYDFLTNVNYNIFANSGNDNDIMTERYEFVKRVTGKEVSSEYHHKYITKFLIDSASAGRDISDYDNIGEEIQTGIIINTGKKQLEMFGDEQFHFFNLYTRGAIYEFVIIANEYGVTKIWTGIEIVDNNVESTVLYKDIDLNSIFDTIVSIPTDHEKLSIFKKIQEEIKTIVESKQIETANDLVRCISANNMSKKLEVIYLGEQVNIDSITIRDGKVIINVSSEDDMTDYYL